MRNLVLFTAIILSFFSCSTHQEDDLIQNEPSMDPNYVTLKDAETVAGNFFSSDRVSTRSGLFGEASVKETVSLKDEAQKDVMHIVNFEGGGFVIIPADSRLNPILAYSEDVFFDNNIEDYPGGLVQWLSVILRGTSFAGGTWPFYDYDRHAWICDGVHTGNDCLKLDDGEIIFFNYRFFHMNWGWWGGAHNGWYGGPGFSVSTSEKDLYFNHDLKMVYQIIP